MPGCVPAGEQAMTVLMERAIQETTTLSESEQDFLAALLLDNIRDTKQWEEQFATSKDVLEDLFDEAMEEYRAGRTTPVNV